MYLRSKGRSGSDRPMKESEVLFVRGFLFAAGPPVGGRNTGGSGAGSAVGEVVAIGGLCDSVR